MKNDLDLYERKATEWWDRRSPAFRSLRSINEHRAEVLLGWVAATIDGALAVDLGCGGGHLSQPLALAGARVVGVDLSAGSLRAARERIDGLFVRGDARRAPLASGVADLVLLADVVEHVKDVAGLLREAARVLVPGGLCYVSTLNSTRRGRFLAVTVAEGLGLVPRGTHDPDLFVSPERLAALAADVGLVVETLQGERIDLWRTLRRWTVTVESGEDLGVSYVALLRREGAACGSTSRIARSGSTT